MFHFDIGVPCFFGYDEDDHPGIQPELYGGAEAGTAPGEYQTPYGFLSAPLAPTRDAQGEIDPALSGQMLYWWDGPRLHVVPTQDPRVIPKLPALKPGESLMFAWRGNFTRHHDDGSISQFTTDDGTPDGRTVQQTVAPDRFERVSPWYSERIDEFGASYVTKSGARLDMGPSMMPDPLGGSSATLAADVVSLEGGLVTLGDPSLDADAVAKSTALLACLQDVKVALAAISSAFTTFVPGSGGAAIPGGAAAATAISAANLLIDGLTLLLPAKSVTAA